MLTEAQITALKLLGYTYTERVISKNGMAVGIFMSGFNTPPNWHFFSWNITSEEERILHNIVYPKDAIEFPENSP
jgi:hypothetical protein